MAQQMEEDSDWKARLRACHHELRIGVIVNNFLAKLHSLLTPVEYSRVDDAIMNGNIPAVDVLVKTLLTKNKLTFDRFCSMLDDPSIGYSHMARKLRGNTYGMHHKKLPSYARSYIRMPVPVPVPSI